MILLAMVVGLLFIARIPAEAAVRLEPVTETRRESGSQPVVVAADERVFTLFAALNAAGFDHEYPGMSMSPVRRRVRVALIEKDLPSLGRLELFFKRIPDYHLVVWVLQRRDPPGFERAEPGWWVTRRAADFDGLDEALGAFYREADIPALWREVEPAYRAEMERWQPVAEQSLIAVQNYLRTSDLPFRQAVIIPNLLDANYSGNGPQVGEIAYVVAGPTETDLNLSGLVEHELLHSMIGPLLDRHIDRIPAQTSRRLYAVLKKSMPSSYGTWAGALEETLNRAINLRMLADADLRAQQLERLEAQGFLLIKPLDQALAAYEQSGQSFEEYLPILLASLEGVKLTGE
jgi:hypothetical protein